MLNRAVIPLKQHSLAEIDPFVSPRISINILIIIKGGVFIKITKLSNDKQVISVILNLSPSLADSAVYKKLPKKFPI